MRDLRESSCYSNSDQGIFGMNVDILEANPSWGWYVVFMAGTLSLTMIVWIVFKRFPDVRRFSSCHNSSHVLLLIRILIAGRPLGAQF